MNLNLCNGRGFCAKHKHNQGGGGGGFRCLKYQQHDIYFFLMEKSKPNVPLKHMVQV